jgi:hypothetical protein
MRQAAQGYQHLQIFDFAMNFVDHSFHRYLKTLVSDPNLQIPPLYADRYQQDICRNFHAQTEADNFTNHTCQVHRNKLRTWYHYYKKG